MARRADPHLAAQREGTRQRLLGTGMLPGRADELLAAWEAAPAAQDLPRDGRFWEAADQWIAAQRRP